MSDLISRQHFDERVRIAGGMACEELSDDFKNGVLTVLEMLKTEPSVHAEPRTGHWIEPQQDDGMSDPIEYQVRCSNCGWDIDPQTWYEEMAHNYCPNCGTKMEEQA